MKMRSFLFYFTELVSFNMQLTMPTLYSTELVSLSME